MAHDTCSACGQRIQQAHKETMNKNLLTGLQAAARNIISSGRNDFDLHELFSTYNLYNNFQKLRYFGMVHHVKDTHGNRVRGHWLITRRGWAFLRGEVEAHKWVTIRGNHIVERSHETVSVRDVFYGADVIQTAFEYFDESGNPVGYRPVNKPSAQVAML